MSVGLCFNQSQLDFPAYDAHGGFANAIGVNGTIFDRCKHSIILCDKVGRDQHIVSCLHGEYGSIRVAGVVRDRLHDEVVRHHYAVKAQFISQNLMYSR